MNNPPAFPNSARPYPDQDGMSLRDYFAAKAMDGFIARGWEMNDPDENFDPLIAKWAYEIADAMLAEREKQK